MKVRIMVTGTLDVDRDDVKGLQGAKPEDKLTALAQAEDLQAKVSLSKGDRKALADEAAEEARKAEELTQQAADAAVQASADAIEMAERLTAEAAAKQEQESSTGEDDEDPDTEE